MNGEVALTGHSQANNRPRSSSSAFSSAEIEDRLFETAPLLAYGAVVYFYQGLMYGPCIFNPAYESPLVSFLLNYIIVTAFIKANKIIYSKHMCGSFVYNNP